MIDFNYLEQQNGLPSGLLSAVMNQESGGNTNAISPKGAIGAFQFMPQTAQQYGINPVDPDQSAQAAATMLGQLSQKYNGDMPSVLAGYNWGQGNVDRQGLQNAPPETQNYIQNIMGKLGNAVVPSAQASEMPSKMDLMLEAERRGILPQDKQDLLNEARSRGLIPGLQAQKPNSNLQANGKQPSPQNTNNLSNNQDNSPESLMENIHNWASSPTNVDLTDLPQSGNGLSLGQKLEAGATALGRGIKGLGIEAAKSTVGGLADLMDYNKVQREGNLSPQAVMTLAMLSPTSIASPSRMAMTQEPHGMEASDLISSAANDEYQNGGLALPPPSNNAVVPKGSSFVAGLKAQAPETLQSIAAQMKSSAGDIYDQMRSVGAVYGDEKAQSIKNAIDTALGNPSFIPELNPKTVAIANKIKQVADTGELSLGDLDQYRRLLQRVGNTEDGVSAGVVKKAIDSEVLSSVPEDLAAGDIKAVDLLQKGRAAYANASKFEDIADIIAKANGDPNRIKAGFQRFVSDPANLKGYSMDQIAALKNAANTGIGENILKAFGKFGFDFSKSGTGNTVLPALSIVSHSIGNPMGVPLAVGGTIARQGQKYLARGKAQQALDMFKMGAQ